MNPGQKYRIITKVISGVWNKPREMVLVFLEETDTEYIFSARPLAGTQQLDKSSVAAMYEVHPSTEIMLPKIYRGEIRVV